MKFKIQFKKSVFKDLKRRPKKEAKEILEKIDYELAEIADTQPESIIMVPLGFVSNNVETLYEIDILYKDLAESLGITNYYRVDTPDADPDYAKSMANLLQRKIREN